MSSSKAFAETAMIKDMEMESIGQFANLPCGSISIHGVYKTV